MLDFISRTPVLWALFAAVIAVYTWLYLGLEAVGGSVLDFQMNGEDALALLEGMTAEQKTAHFWSTVIKDTAYPLAYGSLLTGLVWRFGGGLRQWLIWPAIGAVVFDLSENTVQALALSGHESLLGLKDVLTPVKFALAFLAIFLAVGFLLFGIIRKLRSQSG